MAPPRLSAAPGFVACSVLSFTAGGMVPDFAARGRSICALGAVKLLPGTGFESARFGKVAAKLPTDLHRQFVLGSVTVGYLRYLA